MHLQKTPNDLNHNASSFSFFLPLQPSVQILSPTAASDAASMEQLTDKVVLHITAVQVSYNGKAEEGEETREFDFVQFYPYLVPRIYGNAKEQAGKKPAGQSFS